MTGTGWKPEAVPRSHSGAFHVHRMLVAQASTHARALDSPVTPERVLGPPRRARLGGGALRRGPAAAAPPCARRYCRGGGIRHRVYISRHTGSRYGSGVGSLVFAVPLLAVGRRLRLSAQRR